MAGKKDKKIIVGNWKMNPNSQVEALRTFESIKKKAGKLRNVQTVICPPAIYLSSLGKKVTGHRCVLGAQNTFWENKTGSFTGETSADMLSGVGAEYVIVGHSERRAIGEDNKVVGKKLISALKAGMNIILCVGEQERDNDGEYLRFIAKELVIALNDIPRRYCLNVIIAYEPIWAIGKDAERPATPEDVHEMSIFIRKVLSEVVGKDFAMTIPILYGGSVNPKNSQAFLESGGIQGLLVGRASLKAETFNKILEQSNETSVS